jgi:hypothetical protein
MKLTDDQIDFLTRVRDGRRLKFADRAEDRVRQSCRRTGLAQVEKVPRRWTITEAGRLALQALGQ